MKLFKSIPYWLKGGLLGVIIGGILVILALLYGERYPLIKPIIWIIEFPIVLLYVYLTMSGVLIPYTSNRIIELGIPIFVGIIYNFVLGALIGSAVRKIRHNSSHHTQKRK